jgi:hypothetical protein
MGKMLKQFISGHLSVHFKYLNILISQIEIAIYSS